VSRKKNVASMIALSILLSALDAEAGEDDRRTIVEIGIATGAFIPSKDHELYDSQSRNPHAPLDTVGFDLSLKAAYFPLPYLGVGVEGGFSPIKTETDRATGVFLFRGHLIAQLPWIVTPYLLAGGGMIGLTSKHDALGNDVDPALHWGAGAKVALSSHVSLFVDGRHIISARQGPSSGNTNHFEVFAGVSIALLSSDSPDETPAPVPIVERAVAPPPVEIAAIVEAPPQNEELDCTKAANNPECRVDQVVKAELERVHFDWGKADLMDHDRDALDNAAELLLEHGELRVEIDGHTDSTGPERFNVWLSHRRASAVKAYLIAKGIDPERVAAQGFGPKRPVATNSTTVGRASNRRSDIRVLTEE
jgi:outer membrane protein OmpA-like peptidoglycan-associated protein